MDEVFVFRAHETIATSSTDDSNGMQKAF